MLARNGSASLELLLLLACLTASAGLYPRIALAQGPAFTEVAAGLAAVGQSSVAWADYDNDGDLDFVLSGNTGAGNVSKLYRNSGGSNHTFTEVVAGLAGVSSSSLAWGDYDNDGDLDLLLTGYTGSVYVSRVYRNNGGANPTFADIAAGLTGVYGSSVAWGDYDNDGDLDILLAGEASSGAVSKIYRNNGGANPAFTDIAAGLAAIAEASVAWGDYDNDGDLDILLTGSSTSGAVSRIYRNSGGTAPTFTDIGAGLTGVHNSSVAWVDYDNDGDLDLFLTGDTVSGPASKIYRNSGGANPGFADVAAGLTAGYQPSAAWGDYDNDGDLDLIVTGYSGSGPVSQVYQNSGGLNPSFTSVAASLAGVYSSAVAWADFDNDGDLDLLLTGATDSEPASLLYRNLSSTPNTAPSPPTGLSAQGIGSNLAFTWAAGGDAQTPTLGLNYNLRIGSSAGAIDIVSPMANPATGQRSVARIGTIQASRKPIVLPSNFHANLYWSVQAIDGAFAGSPFSAEQLLALSGVIASLADVPGDQGGWLRLTLNRSPLDDASIAVPVASYGVWRHIPGTALVAASSSGPQPLMTEAISTGRIVGSTLTAFPPGTWELVATIPALQQAQYVAAVPTISNATANELVVTASTTTPSIWFASAASSGQSSDNLMPAQPASFSGTYSGGAHLTWGANAEPDLAGYKLYRGAEAEFIPAPSNLVATVNTTSYVDMGAASGSYFKLSAIDVNGNASAFATTQAGTMLGVDEHFAVAFALEGARPNPAAASRLNVSFALPAYGSARLELLDMGGRRVAEREVGSLGSGRHTMKLAEGHKIAPGLYWLRLSHGAQQRSMRVTVIE